MSAGNLNLRGFTLTANDEMILTGGIIRNGNLSGSNISNVTNTTFTQNISITKTGNSNNDWAGGNTFNGPTSITNDSNNRLRLASNLGDTFNQVVTFQNQGNQFLEISYSGTNTFARQITINNLNPTGEIRFGENGGTSTLNTGGVVTTNFNSGSLLEFNNFTQVQNSANGSFTVTDFLSVNSTFQGNFSVTTGDDLIFQGNNIFNGTNSFIAGGNLDADGINQFSVPSGTSTTFVKNGNVNDDWSGGNTFGTVSFTNNSNNRLRLANNTGDNYLRTATFTNNGTNFLGIAYSGTNTFAQQITINNTNPQGEMRFGEGGGSSTLATGAVVTTNFNTGNLLEFNNFTQIQSSPNGSFTVDDFFANNSTFLGDFTVITGDDLIFQGDNIFNGNNSFTAGGNLDADGINQFSVPTGTSTVFIKNGNVTDDWGGGNTFGTVSFTNNSNGRFRLASVIGDTFLRSSTFTNNGNNFLGIAFNGTNTFAQQITINNTNAAGEVRFGEGGGISTLATGGVVTSNFSVGNLLEFNNFTQVQNSPNGNFGVNTFNSNSSSFQGDFGVVATTVINFQNNNTYARNASFSAPAISANNANNFATSGGIATFTRSGGGQDNWNGGNTFGVVVFRNTANGRIRLANNIGDTFQGDASFVSLSSGPIEPAYNNTSTFAGNISTVGSTQPITFGLGNGSVEINGNSTQQWLGDAARSPIVERLRMNTSGTLTMGVPLLVDVQADFTNGVIFTNLADIISFDDGVNSPINPSNASHINGPVRKIGNDNFDFPTGAGGIYAPLRLGGAGGAANSDIYTAQYFRVGPVDIPTDTTSRDATIGLMSRSEHWELSRSSGSLIRSIDLSYEDPRTSPLIDHTELQSIYWDGTTWRDLMSTVSGNSTSGTISAGTTQNLGFFSIGNSFRILPIELLSFDALLTHSGEIAINWETASERNNDFFTLEKSFDGEIWTIIALIPGAGNSQEITNYNYLDKNARYGRQFYRLTQTDFDGMSETFQVIGVSKFETTGEAIGFALFPNPTTDRITIRSENINLDEVDLSILDSQGREVLRLDQMNGTLQEVELGTLPKGLYLVRLSSLRGQVTKKVILN